MWGMLGLSGPVTTAAELRRAYLAAVLEVHPDVCGGAPDAADKFRDLTAAYHSLLDAVDKEGGGPYSSRQPSAEATRGIVRNRLRDAAASWGAMADTAQAATAVYQEATHLASMLSQMLTSCRQGGGFRVHGHSRNIALLRQTLRGAPVLVRSVVKMRPPLPEPPRPLLLCGAVWGGVGAYHADFQANSLSVPDLGHLEAATIAFLSL